MSWTACIKLQKVRTSRISDDLKVKFFKACVEPVLLYGSETWTLNRQFEKRLNGCYAMLLLKVRNLYWKRHPKEESDLWSSSSNYCIYPCTMQSTICKSQHGGSRPDHFYHTALASPAPSSGQWSPTF